MDYIAKGKKLLLCIGGFIIFFDLLSSIYLVYRLLSYPSSMFSSIIINSFFRLLAETVLLIFCYKGNTWSKWILCTIMLFLSIFLLLQFTYSGSFLFFIISLIFLVGCAILFTSPSIKAFMNKQRIK